MLEQLIAPVTGLLDKFIPDAGTNLLLEHIGLLFSHTMRVGAHQLVIMIWTFGQTIPNHVSIGTRHRMMVILDKMLRKTGPSLPQIWAAM